ncbi:thiol:disulfide interchange protein DsbA/DsbL [Undibacterium sp.]|uniref:thiol:disulfide interchange protein DsbA/DsbL n=1 Tax=Undibacterium sp. TaxID=1914977 RepID=UPI00374D1AD8
MRYFRLLFAACIVASAAVAGAASASPANPKEGADYMALTAPQPAQSVGKKIEVIEFFMYHCPACNALEPELLDWVKKQGDGIVFRRIHMPLTGANDPEAHLFLTLEAMKIEDTYHAKVLQSWHVDHVRLRDDADNLNWAVKNGLDKTRFSEFYNSFAVKTKLQNMPRLVSNYKVDSTPTFVVDGHYLTNAGLVDAANPGTPRPALNQTTLQVVDALVAKARVGK